MSGHYFLSYSSADGLDLALRLHRGLREGTPPVPLWLDKLELRPGPDWDEQVVEALRTCRGLLFMMTADSVSPHSVCKREWSRALSYKKPVVPLLFGSGLEVPFRLQDRQHLDFTQDFDSALARLRDHLRWQESPAGALQLLKDRLAEARRDAARAVDPHQRRRAEDEMAWLEARIPEQQHLADDPQKAAGELEGRIRSGSRGAWIPPGSTPSACGVRVVNLPPAVAPAYYQGRGAETDLIGQFLRDESRRLLTVVGRGGTGKTVLVCRFLQALQGGRLPSGEPLDVAAIVYLGGNSSRRLTFAHLFSDLARLLPDEAAAELELLRWDHPLGPEARMAALLAALPRARPIIILLDNFEDVLDTATQDLRDADFAAALRALLNLPQHPVKVIVTTRLAARQLALVHPARQTRLDLDEGLTSAEARNVLRAMDADGKLGLGSAPEPLIEEACQRTRGYPRALEALFAILSADRCLSLADVLQDGTKGLPENVVEVLVGEAFSRLDSDTQRAMQALAVYGRPAPSVAVDYLLQPYLPAFKSETVLNLLVNMRLAVKEERRYALHSSDRDYALSRVQRGQQADRAEGPAPPFTQFALLQRGADYFQRCRQAGAFQDGKERRASYLAEFDLRYAAHDYETAAAVLAEADQVMPNGDDEPATVLVVDDSSMDRYLAGACLDLLGMRTLFASSGEEALAIINRETPDIVLTDMLMPAAEVDGFGLVEAIRAQRPLLPVILMTAHGSEDIAIQALRRGAASYVPKKALAHRLGESIQQVLSASRATRRHQQALACLTHAEFHFVLDNNPALVPAVVGYLQQARVRMRRPCPQDGTLIGIALREALLNAIYHGNLELAPQLREDEAAYRQLVVERQRQAPYRDRLVYLAARESSSEVVFIVRDEGPGFDPDFLPDPTDSANLEREYGRGLVLIKIFMDRVEHNASGNQITMTKYYP